MEELRAEAAANRVKAQRTETLAQELFLAKVTALGKLEDPTDLAYDEALLADEQALTAAVDELLARKPHLATRLTKGDIGGGAGSDKDAGAVSLSAMLAARA